MKTKFSSKDLSHLGIVGGMIDELGIVEATDQQLQIDGISRNVSIEILRKALITNDLDSDLDFSQRTLYNLSCYLLLWQKFRNSVCQNGKKTFN